jgi:hypothetical protein
MRPSCFQEDQVESLRGQSPHPTRRSFNATHHRLTVFPARTLQARCPASPARRRQELRIKLQAAGRQGTPRAKRGAPVLKRRKAGYKSCHERRRAVALVSRRRQLDLSNACSRVPGCAQQCIATATCVHGVHCTRARYAVPKRFAALGTGRPEQAGTVILRRVSRVGSPS